MRETCNYRSGDAERLALVLLLADLGEGLLHVLVGCWEVLALGEVGLVAVSEGSHPPGELALEVVAGLSATVNW